ncbi:MAG: N-acetyl-gamma-glutamyl-phosphate reductase [Desulfobulbaceae bacterium]|nr:N-acetyl-gamma-glutamyl-phosphate reductase [Desulfobulbaceae bacterium]
MRVGLVGASGYTGAELARILSNHPRVELTVATSRQHAGVPLAQVFPHLQGRVDIVCEDVVIDALPERADLFFLAVPHQTAMSMVPKFLEAGRKVVDLSADFRIRDAATYEAWYQPHSSAQYLDEAVYGLPELYRDKVRQARLVANPGCYPTSVILALAPLLKAGVIDPDTLIVDSKSGVSGAGRGASVGSLYCEMGEGFKAYKVAEHRHTPEIEQELSVLAGRPVVLSFTPHLLPTSRGILSTIYAKTTGGLSEGTVVKLYDEFYRGEQFVRICAKGNYPATQFVRGSNFCDIGFKLDPRTDRIVVLSAIDNLVKGAAGQAVQNMNLLCGFPEGEGLAQMPLFP